MVNSQCYRDMVSKLYISNEIGGISTIFNNNNNMRIEHMNHVCEF
jgi:hypothetical protein